MHIKKSVFIYLLQFLFMLFSVALVGYLLHLSQTVDIKATNQAVFHTNVAAYLLTITILFLLYLAIYGLINRFFYATAVYYIFFGIYIVANRLKVAYRKEPIMPSDLALLRSWKQLFSMISWKIVVLAIVSFVMVVVFCVFLGKHFSKDTLQFNLITRIILVVLGVATIGSFYNVDKQGSMMNKITAKTGYINFAPNISLVANTTGPLLPFLGNIHTDIMDEPKGYSEETMQKIYRKYQKTAQRINKNRPNNNLNKQTLIFVLSESFSDPQRVPNVTINQDPIPKINQIKQENTSGLMLSSGYGGGTANMEYMTFTGLAYNQFAKSLQSPYTQLVVNQKHPVNIINSFDYAAAIHPYYGNFYDRDIVYPKLGFDVFKNLQTKGKDALQYHSKLSFSTFVSDESSYKETLKQVNSRKKGQFISLVTMQNHMPFNVMYDNTYFTYNGTAAGMPEQVANYTNGINYTDNSTKEFLDKLDAIQKPITVVWYGDHLPGMYDKNSMEEYNVVQHETDYFIYSNKYALEHNYGTKKVEQNTAITDSNGFIPIALKQMKQKVTPYYALLTEVQENLPATAKNSVGNSESLMVDQNGKQLSAKQLTKSQREIQKDYRLVQYDLTAGKGYLKTKINK